MFMDQKGISDQTDDHKMDDVMLPGFRFHPTDEELVGFYLKKKIQHRSLPIELIKQVDIYKYDPWDLPNLAPTGEKEWYFYCPRDRKYKNSTRPNRVTGAGFWKATGTDRPIYSSDGAKCIGLKKSLVFYRGRAAKGIKTDWMMHEFRLPSLVEPTSGKKNIQDKNLPPNDGWAICRIFKKMNSMAQRPLYHHSSFITQDHNSWSDFFSQPSSINAAFSGLENTFNPPPFSDFRGGFMTDNSIEPSANNNNVHVASSSMVMINLDHSTSGTNNNSDHDQTACLEASFDNLNGGGYGGFPSSFPATDEWKLLHMGWDSPPTCASESTTTYSTNRSHN